MTRLSAWPVLVALALIVTGCGRDAPSGVATVEPPAEGVAQLLELVGPAVVNVDTVAGRDEAVSDSVTPDGVEPTRSVGSGFVLRSDGLIVTNHHVVSDADTLTVTLDDGRRFTGRVIGSDHVTDLALVRIDAVGLPTLPLAPPDSIRAGEFVLAIGSPFGLQRTATWGIISATDRVIAQNPRVSYIQTDAPINPGNSGGPLVDLEGRVVGVNNAVATEAEGIGFAVPVETLNRILPQLEARGAASHAWLGVTVATAAAGGAEVREIAWNGPAKDGLKVGDRITALDGSPIAGGVELIRRVEDLAVGQAVELWVVRDKRPLTVTINLAELPRE